MRVNPALSSKLWLFMKFLIIFAVVCGVIFGIPYYLKHRPVDQSSGIIPDTQSISSTVTPAAPVPTAPIAKPSANSGFIPDVPDIVAPAPLAKATGSGETITCEILAWNAQIGLLAANQGALTVPGSIMDRYGVKVKLVRKNDYSDMQNDLITGNIQCISVMGNGSPAVITALTKGGVSASTKGVIGYSRGEDKMMGSPKFLANPQLLRGTVGVGVKLDGDPDIGLLFLKRNNIPVNVDGKTYDPDKFNLVYTSSFVDADNMYIAWKNHGTGVALDEVKNGVRTGNKVTKGIDVVFTWTPGDVAVVHEAGGLITLASTGDDIWLMPATVIFNDKWAASHRDLVENFFTAALEGGKLVRSGHDGLMVGAKASSEVYGEDDKPAEWWAKYYVGVDETVTIDGQKYVVRLGGSIANTLGDAAYAFGLTPNSRNLTEAMYTSRGTVASFLYPDDLPTFTPASKAIDTSYVKHIYDRAVASQTVDVPVTPTYSTTGPKVLVADRSYQVNFPTNSYAITHETEKGLQEILANLTTGGALTIEVHGHTDNTGIPAKNMILSKQRAQAVKDWFVKQGGDFTSDRITVIPHGGNDPVATNDTTEGKAQNRRVEIKLFRASK